MLILEEMINPDAKVLLQHCNETRGSVCLTERNKPDSKVNIVGIPREALVIKVDNYWSPERIFSHDSRRGHCKRADFIIVVETERKRRILFIEMKSTSKQHNAVEQQLRGAACFIEYCKAIANHFWNEPKFLSQFEPRFVSFSHTSIAKKPTRIDRNTLNNAPETMMKLQSAQRAHFDHLVGS